MASTIVKLTEMKEKIEKASQANAEAEGRLKVLLDQLKQDHGCTSVAAAEKKIVTLEKQNAELTTEINEGIASLEEDYDL